MSVLQIVVIILSQEVFHEIKCLTLLMELYLQTFVNRFEAAKAKLREASAVVADGAVTAAQQLSTRAFRVSLDIRLKAPVIFIPRSSVSHHVLVIDLGRLTVSNYFKTVDEENARTADGIPAVVDHMSVDLTDMKLSTYVPMMSCVMLPCCPFCLFFSVEFFMSIAWFPPFRCRFVVAVSPLCRSVVPLP